MKHVYVFSKMKKEHAIVRSILEYWDSLTIDQLPIHTLMFHFLYQISSKKTLLEFFLFFVFDTKIYDFKLNVICNLNLSFMICWDSNEYIFNCIFNEYYRLKQSQ